MYNLFSFICKESPLVLYNDLVENDLIENDWHQVRYMEYYVFTVQMLIISPFKHLFYRENASNPMNISLQLRSFMALTNLICTPFLSPICFLWTSAQNWTTYSKKGCTMYTGYMFVQRLDYVFFFLSGDYTSLNTRKVIFFFWNCSLTLHNVKSVIYPNPHPSYPLTPSAVLLLECVMHACF